MSTCEVPSDDLDLLAAVIANVPVGVLAADSRLRCAYANERLARMAARPPGHLRDEGFVNAVNPDDRARLTDTCETVVLDRREMTEEVRLRAFDGTDRHVQVRLTPLTAADGAVRGVVGVVQECAEPTGTAVTALEPTIGYVAHLD